MTLIKNSPDSPQVGISPADRGPNKTQAPQASPLPSTPPSDAFAKPPAATPKVAPAGREPALAQPKPQAKTSVTSAPSGLKYPPDLQRLSKSYGIKAGTSLTADLQSPDAKVRFNGLRQLEKAPGNWDPYVEMVAHDSDPKVRKEMRRLMFKYENQVSPALLNRIISKDLTPETPKDERFTTLGLLCFVKTIDVGPYLKQYAQDPDERFRRSVVQTVAYRFDNISKSDAHTTLMAQLKSENPDHRLLVIDIMSKKRSMPLSPYLAMCAGDASPKLRKVVYAMLADGDRLLTLDKADANAIFKAELTAPDADRRLTAIKVLKTIPRVDKRSLLTACIGDATSSDKVRKAAQKALDAAH